MNNYQPIESDFKAFKKLLLSSEGAQKEYEALSDEFLLIAEMLRARKHAKKTQKDVAEVMKTTYSVISRLESLEGQKRHSPTLKTLRKYAHAVGCCLSIKFEPEHQRAK